MLVPWTRQPTGAPRIDWSNPLTKGLAYADPGQYGRNLVSGLPSTALTGTKVQTSAGGLVRGFGSTFGTGSTDANVTSLTAHATHRTYWIRVMRNGGGGGNLGRLFEKRTGGAQSELLFYDASLNLLQFGRVHSVTNGQWGAPTNSLPTGSVVAFAVTYDSSSTSNVPAMYINGAPVTVTASSSPSGTPTNNSDAYVIGNRTNDSLRNWDGWIGEFLVWDRILSPAEIARISANPWQIFRPIVVPVKAPASGGADYPVTQTEAATGSDTTSCLIGYAPAATEAGSASDAASAAMAAVVAIIEAASATSSEAAVTARQAAITEAATATDTTNGTASGDYTATITEAATASSLEAAVSNYLAAISESASASDSASASLPGEYSVSISEAANAIETAVCAMSALVTINEAAAAADVANWVGAITFTRAPRGSGYPGTKPTTTRGGQTNTTRPTMANTRR